MGFADALQALGALGHGAATGIDAFLGLRQYEEDRKRADEDRVEQARRTRGKDTLELLNLLADPRFAIDRGSPVQGPESVAPPVAPIAAPTAEVYSPQTAGLGAIESLRSLMPGMSASPGTVPATPSATRGEAALSGLPALDAVRTFADDAYSLPLGDEDVRVRFDPNAMTREEQAALRERETGLAANRRAYTTLRSLDPTIYPELPPDVVDETDFIGELDNFFQARRKGEDDRRNRAREGPPAATLQALARRGYTRAFEMFREDPGADPADVLADIELENPELRGRIGISDVMDARGDAVQLRASSPAGRSRATIEKEIPPTTPVENATLDAVAEGASDEEIIAQARKDLAEDGASRDEIERVVAEVTGYLEKVRRYQQVIRGT